MSGGAVYDKMSTDNNYDLEGYGFGIGARPGILYTVSDRMALEGTFGYLTFNHSRSASFDNYNSTFFGLQLNPSTLNFGFNYYF